MRAASLPLLLGVGLAACGSSSSSDGKEAGGRISVATAFYPLQEATERIGGDHVSVVSLTPAGGEPHDLELTPKTLEELEGADAVVYLSKGFQPAVEKAVADLPSSTVKLDALDGLDLLPVDSQLEGTQGEVDGEELKGGYDPHVWVDPALQAKIATSIEKTLSDVDPSHATEYRKNLDTYVAELEGLSSDFEEGLAECKSRTIVTSHRAFGYLAKAYGLEQIPIAGISPDEEPDPKSLEAVAKAAKADGVKVIFFESTVPKALSETVAREIGATTSALDPVETISQDQLDEGVDYASIQRDNLAELEKALRCS
jgi:zinc transport system substrate-binding protein